MSKLLLNIYFPGDGRYFDVKIPQHLTVREATDMLVEFLKTESAGVSGTDYILCNLENGAVYNKSDYMGNLGLHTGSKLMLI